MGDVYYCNNCRYLYSEIIDTEMNMKRMVCGNKFSIYFSKPCYTHDSHCHSGDVRHICENCSQIDNCSRRGDDYYSQDSSCEKWKPKTEIVDVSLFSVPEQMNIYHWELKSL
jgi:hypothetical protein